MGFRHRSTQQHPFTDRNIRRHAPQDNGVYGVFSSSDECIYVGRATRSTTIRGRLLSALNSDDCIAESDPSYFTWETSDQITGTIPAREQQLIRYYQRQGQAGCNERIG